MMTKHLLIWKWIVLTEWYFLFQNGFYIDLLYHLYVFLSVEMSAHGSGGQTCQGQTKGFQQMISHFADNIFKFIFLNENVWISIKISLKFVTKGPNNNIPVLVQIMAWHWPGEKPLSEPMMIRSLTHICLTRPQWVKDIDKISKKSAWKLENFHVLSLGVPEVLGDLTDLGWMGPLIHFLLGYLIITLNVWFSILFYWLIPSCEITLCWMPQSPIGYYVNIDSGDGLVPSGNKPSPKPCQFTLFWHIEAFLQGCSVQLELS